MGPTPVISRLKYTFKTKVIIVISLLPSRELCLVVEQRLWILCNPILEWQSLLQLAQIKTDSSCAVDTSFCLLVS